MVGGMYEEVVYILLHQLNNFPSSRPTHSPDNNADNFPFKPAHFLPNSFGSYSVSQKKRTDFITGKKPKLIINPFLHVSLVYIF